MIEFRAIATLTEQVDFRGLCRAMLDAVTALDRELRAELLEAFETHNSQGEDAADGEAGGIVLRQADGGEELPAPAWLPAVLAASERPDAPRVFVAGTEGATGDVLSLGTVAGMHRFLRLQGKASPQTLASIVRVATVFGNLLALMDRFERDALTGLLNRQSFDYRFEDVLDRYRRNPRRARVGLTPWLAIADIDHFKQINDSFGHLYGDEILLLFSRLMRENFRCDDLLFRYGGEEFVIILNNTNAAGALQALERMREAVGNFDFPTVGRVTVSVGWVCVHPNALPSDLMHWADKALYRAKADGRNRAVSYEAVYGEIDLPPPPGQVDLF